MKYWRRAFHDSFSGLLRPAGLGAIGFGLAFLGYAYRLGWEAAMGEFQIWWISAAGSIGAIFLLFLWNLACAPYRIQYAARVALEHENESLKKLAQKSKERHLNKEQQASLTDAIRSSGIRPDHLNVMFYPASEECSDFATDIGDAILASGIKCSVHNGIMYEHDQKDRGIKIIYGKQSKTLDALAKTIQAQLKEIGFLSEKRRRNDDHDQLFIYVARSPDY